MKLTFLDKLACPFDKQDLAIKIFRQEQNQILEGLLTCEHCHRYYPIVQGIPIMSPDEYREIQLELPLLEKWGEKLQMENGKPVFQLASGRQLRH
jgi:uncharacterized protein YbaR (Trm112 family)